MKERMIKAVIFDQDGVMFDTERMSAKAWEKAGKELGVVPEEAFLCTVRGMNYRDATARFEAWSAGKNIDCEELRRRKKEYFTRMRKEQSLPVKPGLHELLAYLKEQGYKITLATGSAKEYSLGNLKEAGVEDYFEHIISGDMVAHAKPSPEMFLKSAQVLGERPEHCLVLEDSLNGVEAGINGGFITVMVPDMTQPDEKLRARVDQVCESLLEVRDWLQAMDGEASGDKQEIKI